MINSFRTSRYLDVNATSLKVTRKLYINEQVLPVFQVEAMRGFKTDLEYEAYLSEALRLTKNELLRHIKAISSND